MSVVKKAVGVIAGVAAFVFLGPQAGALIASVAFSAAKSKPSGAKPSPIQGSITNITIGADQATPMMIGSIYSGGALVHQAGYGAAVDGVSNPYLGMAVIYSAGGPIAGIDSYWADFAQLGYSGASSAGAATGYFNGFLYWNSQTGATPEGAALAAQWGGMPYWGSAYKLSGYAAALWSLKWDSKEGKFTSGAPRLGIQGRGVLTWDPRKDSTWPGGSGAHRWVDPRANPAGFAAAKASWSYSDRPGLHALRYALGTWERDPAAASGAPWILTYGVGIPIDGIVVSDFVELENICDANNWRVAGILLEPESKWENLKRILAAGGAEPCFKGGKLGLKITAPRVALDTITHDDLADGRIEAAGAQPRTDRINTVVPKFRSPAHKWELQQSDEIVISDYLTADKEEKRREEVFEFVTSPTQAAQLATYRLFDSREQGPIELRCKPRLRRYAGGDMLTLSAALRDDLGLAQSNVVVLKRAIDPVDMVVTLTLVTENQLKHIAAMSVTGNAPATIALPTTQQLDQSSGVNDALDQLAALAEDGLLTRFEKITKLIPLSTELADRWTLLQGQASALTGFSEVSTAQATAATAYGQWTSFRDGLSPAWNDVGSDTAVDRATYDARVNVLQAALGELDQAVRRAATAINNVNLIRNSDFPLQLQGFAWAAAGVVGSGYPEFGVSLGGRRYLKIVSSMSAAEQEIGIVTAAGGYLIPAVAGARYAVRAEIEALGPVSFAILNVQWYDASGVYIPGSAVTVDAVYGEAAFPTVLRGFVVAPSGAASYQLALYVRSSGAGSVSAVLAHPMASIAKPGQTQIPDYASGVADGAAGAAGAAGANGINTATINIYQRGATAPALPSAATTYDFAAKVLAGLNNGWSTTIPAGTAPLWQSAATAAGQGATDSIAASEWAAAVQIAANGANAASTAPVILYRRTDTPSPPSVPSGIVTYTFGTATATGIDNGWAQSLPATGGPYRWQINASAVSTSGTDTIAPGEWSAPQILAQDGSDAQDGFNRLKDTGFNQLANWDTYASAGVALASFSSVTNDTTGKRALVADVTLSGTATARNFLHISKRLSWTSGQRYALQAGIQAVNVSGSAAISVVHLAAAFWSGAGGLLGEKIVAVLNGPQGFPTYFRGFLEPSDVPSGTAEFTLFTRFVFVDGTSGTARAVLTEPMVTTAKAGQVEYPPYLPGVLDGVDGVPAINGILTNESATVAAASDGSVASFSGTGGTFRVFFGLGEVTTGAGASYSVVAASGVSIAIDSASGVYSISGMSADTGSATLRATFGGVNIDRVYSIAKSRAGANGINGTNGTNGINGSNGADGANGANGADAKTLIVLSDRQTIAYDASGLPSPTAQTITFTTNKQNTSQPVYWSITDANGVGVSVSYLSAASGDSVTMTEANFAIARNGTSGVIVTGFLTDGTVISDKISVIAVRAGANGADGANGSPGTSTAQLTIYQRASSTPAVPSSTATYSFAAKSLTGLNNGWSVTIPAGSDPVYTSQAFASSTGATASIASGDWSTPTIAVQNGQNATSVRAALAASDEIPGSGTTETTIATASITLPAGGQLKISGGLNSVVGQGSQLSIATLRLKLAGNLIASAALSIAADGQINTDGTEAWTGQLFSNPTSGPATLSITRQRGGPSVSGGASYALNLIVEHVT